MPVTVGVDETGRGSCFGPIVTCAAAFPEGGIGGDLMSRLADSKALSARKREAISAALAAAGTRYAFGAVSAPRVDLVNPLRGTMEAMAAAVLRLGIPDSYVIVDGPFYPSLDMPGEALVRGDSLIPEIMAASILAKVMRDALLTRLARRYPVYGLERHAGYGTAAHFKAIGSFGATRHHRKTFIRNVVFELRAAEGALP